MIKYKMILSRKITLIFHALALSSCGLSTTQIKSPLITDHNFRYEIERVSVLPPEGDGWSGGIRENGSIGFVRGGFVDRNAGRNQGIAINPFIPVFNANDFEGILRRYTEITENYNSGFKNFDHSPDRPYKKVIVVYKKGMKCVAKEHYSPSNPVAGKSMSVDYVCIPPNQQKELPLLHLDYTESAPPSWPFIGADVVMEPIWRSLQFKTVDLANSAQYQRWKIGNAAFHVRQQKFREETARQESLKRQTQQQQ